MFLLSVILNLRLPYLFSRCYMPISNAPCGAHSDRVPSGAACPGEIPSVYFFIPSLCTFVQFGSIMSCGKTFSGVIFRWLRLVRNMKIDLWSIIFRMLTSAYTHYSVWMYFDRIFFVWHCSRFACMFSVFQFLWSGFDLDWKSTLVWFGDNFMIVNVPEALMCCAMVDRRSIGRISMKLF